MTASPTPRITGIGQVAINARDLPRAVTFYRDVLGLQLLFEVQQMAFFDCGGIRLMVGIASEPRFDHPASILYYRVANITVAHQALVARGVTFEQPPHRAARLETHDLWLAFFADPEGNTLALMAEVARS